MLAERRQVWLVVWVGRASKDARFFYRKFQRQVVKVLSLGYMLTNASDWN